MSEEGNYKEAVCGFQHFARRLLAPRRFRLPVREIILLTATDEGHKSTVLRIYRDTAEGLGL